MNLRHYIPRFGLRAVTILELLVAVSLISFIILALYQMFDRTQVQMRKAVREVDKFEGGARRPNWSSATFRRWWPAIPPPACWRSISTPAPTGPPVRLR